ncbi:Arginase, hepatic [Frankliniella fusca]|uniref:Arginase n=1 Tax=Frankliniella fusca TaxID=407009 RepID=A0AAE1H1X4_9NEOP|nr:Arginase, hepatic [Frankliniella fusca]
MIRAAMLARCLVGAAGAAAVGARSTPRRFASRDVTQKIGILGVPFDKGQTDQGVSAGPGAIRGAGLVEALRSLGHDVQDFGDVSYDSVPDLVGPENMDKYQHVAVCMREVSSLARRIQSEGRICLALGGDHSVTIGTVDATVNAHEDVAVIWVDAHADLNTPATSPSGSAHGMPVALLAKDLADYWPYLPGMDWQVPKLPLSNLAYIGLRSVDEYERLTMEKFNICAFGMQDVESLGITGTVELALRHVDPYKRRAIHLSFDIDALDALEAPSTGTPGLQAAGLQAAGLQAWQHVYHSGGAGSVAVRGGLTLREGIHIMEKVHETGRLAAVDLVEVNPALGSARDVSTTLQAALQLLVAAFGHSRLGNMPRAQELPLTKGATLSAKGAKGKDV